MTKLALTLAYGAVVAKRNLIKIKRVPDILVWTLMSPIMFVVLFAYVFGSSIHIPGVSYREYLIAGIFAQTVIFGSTFTGVGLADDMTKGVIDRFRSLPMARSAVLLGRTGSDIVYNSISILVMSIAGLIIGWRIRTSLLPAIGGFRLLLLFGEAFRRWLERHHDSAGELWVGFYKVGSGKASITWPESVDQALCFGWIDSVRRSHGPDSYMNRFTPRKPGSTWSAANVRRAKELI